MCSETKIITIKNYRRGEKKPEDSSFYIGDVYDSNLFPH